VSPAIILQGFTDHQKHLSREQHSLRVFEIRLHAYASFQGKPLQMLNIPAHEKGRPKAPF
jgi:hypothetical protein